jgi:molybdate transport system ATP-binding protein
VSGLHADLVCRRGDFELAVELTAAPGEIVGIIGPNGAGKSTLLRALAGLEPLAGGRVTVGDRVLADVAAGVSLQAEHRGVGFVFQDYRLFPHLSVLDNVAYGARRISRDHRGRGARRAEAAAWLERLGIAELAARRPAGLSGGQAQRVALARALASSPSLVLLDEPLAALDAHARLETRGHLREHLAGFAGPSVVVTHDAIEALVLADRLVVIEAGRVVQTGAPVEIARRPATPYVARLMGLNLYRGRVTDAAAGVIELDGGGRLECGPIDPLWPAEESAQSVQVAAQEAAQEAAASALVAVAPSAVSLHLSRPGAGSPRNVWPGRVEALELLTDRVRVRVAGTPDALVDVTPAAVAELRLRPGSEVWLSAKASEVEVYPAV